MSTVAHMRPITVEALRDILEGRLDLQTYLFEDKQLQPLYLDKAWHAIHFILNGTAWEGDEPMVDVVIGGTEIEGGETYTVRYLTDEEVKTIASVLEELKGQPLVDRYQPDKMTELGIYPQTVDWESEDELQYVFNYYWEMVDFYRDTAAKGYAILHYQT
ncbi:YfbM family protein [Paenibacillus koleovorans]|uniref:YfbM family protein n=1 Tax=Paenibacillus koleovorans TaxID=121608 RepID=UPI000FD8E5F6|nr:YfbM family protein [Paenibacillus koleovorans]